VDALVDAGVIVGIVTADHAPWRPGKDTSHHANDGWLKKMGVEDSNTP
jgi:hypothetical protein